MLNSIYNPSFIAQTLRWVQADQHQIYHLGTVCRFIIGRVHTIAQEIFGKQLGTVVTVIIAAVVLCTALYSLYKVIVMIRNCYGDRQEKPRNETKKEIEKKDVKEGKNETDSKINTTKDQADANNKITNNDKENSNKNDENEVMKIPKDFITIHGIFENGLELKISNHVSETDTVKEIQDKIIQLMGFDKETMTCELQLKDHKGRMSVLVISKDDQLIKLKDIPYGNATVYSYFYQSNGLAAKFKRKNRIGKPKTERLTSLINQIFKDKIFDQFPQNAPSDCAYLKKKLWHGTKYSEYVKELITNGYDLRKSGSCSSQLTFGEGVYLAFDRDVARRYTYFMGHQTGEVLKVETRNTPKFAEVKSYEKWETWVVENIHDAISKFAKNNPCPDEIFGDEGTRDIQQMDIRNHIIAKLFKDKGYDGVIITDTGERVKEDVGGPYMVIFDPTKISFSKDEEGVI